MVDAVNNGSTVLPTKNQLIPPEGPKTVPLSFDFSVNPSYLVDLQNIMSRFYITIIQGLFFDTTNLTNPVYVTPSISNQPIILPPGSQGYIPALVPTNEAKLTVSSADSETAYIYLLNFPVAPSVWSTGSAGSAQAVSDAILDACVTNNKLATAPYQFGEADHATPLRGGAVLTKETTLGFSAGHVTPVTLFTGAPRAFIKNLSVQMTGNSFLSVAGYYIIQLYENSNANLIWQGEIWLPGAAPTTPTPNYNLVSFADMDYLSQIDNSNIILFGTDVDFGGNIVVHATYGITSIT